MHELDTTTHPDVYHTLTVLTRYNKYPACHTFISIPTTPHYAQIERYQEVLGKVRIMLKQIQLAIKGEMIMTDELAGMSRKI